MFDLCCAVLVGSVIVNTAHAVHRELVTAQRKFVLSNDFHMLYLCIPLELISSIDPNWRIFFDKVWLDIIIITIYICCNDLHR